jgi:hypothetical protein
VIVKDDANSEVVDETTNFEQYYSIVSTPNGPKGGMVHTLTFPQIPGESAAQPLTLQTGKIDRLAAGAIHLQRGDTVVDTIPRYLGILLLNP